MRIHTKQPSHPRAYSFKKKTPNTMCTHYPVNLSSMSSTQQKLSNLKQSTTATRKYVQQRYSLTISSKAKEQNRTHDIRSTRKSISSNLVMTSASGSTTTILNIHHYYPKIINLEIWQAHLFVLINLPPPPTTTTRKNLTREMMLTLQTLN